MSEKHVRISNGKVVRPGFYRSPDGSGLAYANKVASGNLDTDCVFCPEGLERRGVEVISRLGEKGLGAFVIQAKPAYAHFDAQRVVDHKLIIPDAHIDSEYDLDPEVEGLMRQYAREAEQATPEEFALQSYTRSPRNPSKSIGHLHRHLFTLSLDPVSRFSFDIEQGVTEAEFAELTPEQIAEINRSRLP